MFLIVGLGNPGEEYEHTRHNAGFDAVDLIAEEVGARYWKTECGALTTKGVYRDHDLVLAKPQSYMNTSGGPVKQLMNAYGVDAEHLIVVHDELGTRGTTACALSATSWERATGIACAWASGARRDACPWWTGCCRSRRRTRPTTSPKPPTAAHKRRCPWCR